MARDLLIVVGAGASKEVRLPVGSELKHQIAGLLSFRSTNHSQSMGTGDETIYNALQLEYRSKPERFSELIRAAIHIHDAIPLAISIDNFIDAHKSNPDIELVGKLAIVRSILKAEQISSLYVNPRNEITNPNFTNLEDFWLTKFFRLLTENCRVEDLPRKMSAVSMIVFNYDRCIEHFLFHALQMYYGISEGQSTELVSMIKIYHPYGKVGTLPWEKRDNAISFGGDPTAYELRSLAKNIKTFTEGVNEEESEIAAIRNLIRNTETVLYLGFAFHSLNLQLLGTIKRDTGSGGKKCFATALGISEYDREIIRGALSWMMGLTRSDIHIRNDLQCHQIFHEFGRGISLIN